MLSLALSVAMLTSTGGMLADHLPRGVRLLDAPRALPGPPPAFPTEEPVPGDYQSMSLAQLRAAAARIEDSKPSAAGGIVLLAGGITGIVVGLVAILVGVFVPSVGWLVAGLIITAAGLAMTVIGPILMASALRGRLSAERDLDFIQRQIRMLEGGGAPTPAGPPRTPPPPPPPPPLGGLEVVVPMVAVASF